MVKESKNKKDFELVIIESCKTARYILEAGSATHVKNTREQECGWTHKNNFPVFTADDNYYDRAIWKIIPVNDKGDIVLIESAFNGRYLLDTAPAINVS